MTARREALRSAYFALRHGRSEANERGIIVSRPESGVAGYGLSEAGCREARERLARARLDAAGVALAADTIVVSSDFRRARETAELLCELAGLAPPALDARLRERDFGAFELGPNTAYEGVWARDRASATARDSGVEPTAEVAARLHALLDDLERAHAGRAIVLVSHGDPLQILEATLRGLPPNAHRDVPHLETGELRRLTP